MGEQEYISRIFDRIMEFTLFRCAVLKIKKTLLKHNGFGE